MNYSYNFKNIENQETPKKINPNKSYYEERDSFKKRSDDISLFISNFPDEYYKQVITEFSKFGSIKNIFYDNRKFRDCMIIEYENPEMALRVAEIIDNNFLLKYNISSRIKVNLLAEEEKLRLLEKMLITTEAELDTSNYNRNQKTSFATIRNSQDYNKGFVLIEKEKSNWQKFVDVFFNF